MDSWTLGLVYAVKAGISGTFETKGLPDMTVFLGIQNVIPNVYLGLCGMLMDRLNHLICYLISCPVFAAAFAVPFSLLLM
jgi:hypothetical protein